jgi:protein translocase SecG subunit
VLVQLPKKEAGIGMAFGGGATETLFGAGSGTVLTKATKYATGIFMGLALVLSILNTHAVRRNETSLESELQKRAGTSLPVPAPIATNVPPAATASTAAAPNLQLLTTNNASAVPPNTNDSTP